MAHIVEYSVDKIPVYLLHVFPEALLVGMKIIVLLAKLKLLACKSLELINKPKFSEVDKC